MWHAKKENSIRLKRLYIGCCMPLFCCLLSMGCSTVPLADSLDWKSISESNETASWGARRHNALGIKSMNHGKFAKAELHFQKAAELSPRYAAPRNNLGNVCLAREELYNAAWHFERAAELAPFSPEPLINLGLVHERAGQLGQAEEAYRLASEVSPSNPQIIGNLARVLIKSDGDPGEIHLLLKQLMFIDTRPDWLDWADSLLSTRFRGEAEVLSPELPEGPQESLSFNRERQSVESRSIIGPGDVEEIRSYSTSEPEAPIELLPHPSLNRRTSDNQSSIDPNSGDTP